MDSAGDDRGGAGAGRRRGSAWRASSSATWPARRQRRAQAAAAGRERDAGVPRGGGGAGGAGRLVIGGKSMGGRVASMVADELGGRSRAPLPRLSVPSAGAAGAAADRASAGAGDAGADRAGDARPLRDAGGGRGLPAVAGDRLLWLEDGDHDLKPRKSVSGFTAAEHLRPWRGRWRPGRGGCPADAAADASRPSTSTTW